MGNDDGLVHFEGEGSFMWNKFHDALCRINYKHSFIWNLDNNQHFVHEGCEQWIQLVKTKQISMSERRNNKQTWCIGIINRFPENSFSVFIFISSVALNVEWHP